MGHPLSTILTIAKVFGMLANFVFISIIPEDCITDKCFKYPCQHGGKCLPSDQGAVCLCPIGFVGDLCEIRMDLQVTDS